MTFFFPRAETIDVIIIFYVVIAELMSAWEW